VSKRDLIRRIAAFRREYGMPPSTFGRLAVGDANLLTQLKEGRGLRDGTRQKIEAFMKSYARKTIRRAA
jgi:hypothetical protein